jgi:hypothetical protein
MKFSYKGDHENRRSARTGRLPLLGDHDVDALALSQHYLLITGMPAFPNFLSIPDVFLVVFLFIL